MTNSASTTYYHLSPASSAETTTNAATWTSDNGEVYTLNNTGAKPAQIVGSPKLLFDGVAHYLQATFTLNQPMSYYVVAKRPTFSTNGYFIDGNTGANVSIRNQPTTPDFDIYAGSATGINSNWAENSYNVIMAIINGASSSSKVGATAAVSGNAGANNAGGLTVGAAGNGTSPTNIQIKEIIVRTISDSTATQIQIYSYLKAIHGAP
mgnify:CR=1 FL=1